jgi:hypothetical protein
VQDYYTFIYRQLVKDGYIFDRLRQAEVKDFFFEEPYRIVIDKIKTLQTVTTKEKVSFYSITLKSFQ